MSEETRQITTEQLDELLDANVEIAQIQAQEYMKSGQTALATTVLRKAIEERADLRTRILERGRQEQAAAAAATPAATPVSTATGPLAGPGTPPPVAPNPFLSPRGVAMAPPCVRQQIVKQAQAASGGDASSDMSLPMGLTRRR